MRIRSSSYHGIMNLPSFCTNICIDPQLRMLFDVTYLNHVRNEEVLKTAGSTKLQNIVAERRTLHLLSIAVVTG